MNNEVTFCYLMLRASLSYARMKSYTSNNLDESEEYREENMLLFVSVLQSFKWGLKVENRVLFNYS